MFWVFAKVNNHFAEVHFCDPNRDECSDCKHEEVCIFGHGYVERKRFKTKREQRMIGVDLKRYDFAYRNGRYRNKTDGKILYSCPRSCIEYDPEDVAGPFETVEELDSYLRGVTENEK